ncbi:hypothetical protein NC651_015372 [Populus alba x Populus x berolinensis]|nr:hypothetical protein NC651_015372 [Populus alba x Populus x berolinensis]
MTLTLSHPKAHPYSLGLNHTRVLISYCRHEPLDLARKETYQLWAAMYPLQLTTYIILLNCYWVIDQ